MHLEHVKSLVVVKNKQNFIELCENAIQSWKNKRTEEAETALNAYVKERVTKVAKFNKKLFVRLGLRKKRVMEFSTTHYFNFIMHAFDEKMVRIASWFDEESSFKDESNKPVWWIEDDYYALSRLVAVWHKSSAWKDKIGEVLRSAQNENSDSFYVDSELYDLILNWSAENVK